MTRDAAAVKPTRSANRMVASSTRSAITTSPSFSRVTIWPGRMLRSRVSYLCLLQLDPFQIPALAIAPAFALQAGADPRAQQDGIERLRQIVLGARLDAADHAVGLLQTGDHDHRDVVQTLVGLEALEHLEAVQVGHHEIEQNQIELLDLENLQRPAARIRSGHLVTVVAQAAEQQVAVAGIVVDHQDPPGLLRRRVARLDRFDGPDQIGDHAGDVRPRPGTQARRRPSPREKSTITSIRASRLSDSPSKRLEIGTDRGAAELIQLLQAAARRSP